MQSRLNRKNLIRLVGVLVGLFVLLQLLNFLPPFSKSNPPVTNTVSWDSARTEQLMRDTCMDCHSNETVWPWYSYVAPVSLLVAHDVNDGREQLNISTGHRINVREMVEVIEKGEMPPAVYLPTHPEARLSDSEKQELIAGIRATFGQ